MSLDPAGAFTHREYITGYTTLCGQMFICAVVIFSYINTLTTQNIGVIMHLYYIFSEKTKEPSYTTEYHP